MEIERHEIDTPGGRFAIRVIASGEIEIRTPDGMIAVTPHSTNVINVQCVPFWDDATAIKVAAHQIEQGGDSLSIAARVVQTLRGRLNLNKL